MRLIDGDALEKFLSDAEMEAIKRKKYVLAGALNMIQGNVRNFPTIEPESNWISCKERLPEKPDNYPHCGIYRTYSLVSLESGCVKSLAYEFERDEWQATGSPVIALQPLPEPFREEGEQE